MYYTSVCKFCKRMFKTPIRTVCCNDCRHLEVDSFEEIKNYLREYPNSNAIQVSRALNIPATKVLEYVDEGMLHVVRGEFEKL